MSGLKLFVQIPSLNEAGTISEVLGAIPQEISGIDQITTVVVDDGSSDESVAIAREAGVSHVIEHPRHEGLSPTFHRGLAYCLAHGADIIVNTDGDGQYPSNAIPELVAPIVSGSADLAVAKRVMPENYYTGFEKIIHRAGSASLRKLLRVDVSDPPSGFRAYSRPFAEGLHMNTRFSHTMDTLVQSRNARVVNVPVETNYVERSSRLRSKTYQYLYMTMLDLYYALEQDDHRKQTASRLGLSI